MIEGRLKLARFPRSRGDRPKLNVGLKILSAVPPLARG